MSNLTIDKILSDFKALHLKKENSPFIIGITGASSAGKTTFSEQLRERLTQGYPTLAITVISTDSFIYPNQKLRDNHLMERKGFPISFNWKLLRDFLIDLKSDKLERVTLPFYCQMIKDIDSTKQLQIEQSNIYIVEGVSLFFSYLDEDKKTFRAFDYLDSCIYLDPPIPVIQERAFKRFYQAFEKAQTSPTPFFSALIAQGYTPENIQPYLESCWEKMDLALLKECIEPYKHLAHYIVP